MMPGYRHRYPRNILYCNYMKTIVLASASPRRRQLMASIGLDCRVEPSGFAESLEQVSEPHLLAQRLSLGKARAVAARCPNTIVIAADTLGVRQGHLLGKPLSESDAVAMLQSLSGHCHSVITGFTIIDADTGRTASRSVETVVWFRELTAAEIKAYVSTGEPMDKAGAYAIQGLGADFVDRIEGDYFNVMGLPLAALIEALKEFDVVPASNPPSPPPPSSSNHLK
jgi:septum formation protein